MNRFLSICLLFTGLILSGLHCTAAAQSSDWVYSPYAQYLTSDTTIPPPVGEPADAALSYFRHDTIYALVMPSGELYIWLRPDPLMDENIDLSPYVYCNGNPLNYVDPEGRDTLSVQFDGNNWQILNHTVVSGNDIIRINANGIKTDYTFSEGDYGNRKCNLRLYSNDKETLSVYMLSGQLTNGCGFQIENSNCLIADDAYNLFQGKSLTGGEFYPGFIMTIVSGRSGIRTHYQMKEIESYKYSSGCQIVGGMEYSISNGYVNLGVDATIDAAYRVAAYFGAVSISTRMNDNSHPYQIHWQSFDRVSSGVNIFKTR